MTSKHVPEEIVCSTGQSIFSEDAWCLLQLQCQRYEPSESWDVLRQRLDSEAPASCLRPPTPLILSRTSRLQSENGNECYEDDMLS